MSRKIDMENLSDDDKLYLAQRDLLPLEVMDEEEQRKLLDPEQYNVPLIQIANTGDVNLGLVTIEELEAELEKRREVQDAVDPTTLMKSEGIEGARAAEADEDEEDDDTVLPYDQWKKVDLIQELQARNEDRDEDSQFPLGGNVKQLIALLVEDDKE